MERLSTNFAEKKHKPVVMDAQAKQPSVISNLV